MGLFMVIERFKDGDPVSVYRRLRDRGRQMPEGVSYVGSWVDRDMKGCYQVMRAETVELLNKWMDQWKDLVDFDVRPVIESTEAATRVTDRL